MKLVIEELAKKEVSWNDKRTGETKTGMKIGVKYQDKWYSCFQGAWNKDWQQGDVLDVEVEQNGKYLNIKAPRKQDPALAEINKKLEHIINLLENKDNGVMFE